MNPLHLDDNFTLYHGDTLHILPTLPAESVDAIITDPPYCSGAAGLSAKQAEPASKYQQSGTKKTYPTMLGDCRDQRSFTLWLTLWLSECWRIANPGAPALVFSDWRQLPCVVDAVQTAGFGYRGIVVWHKRNARPMLGEFRRDSEFIVYQPVEKVRSGLFQGGLAKTWFRQTHGNFTLFVRKISGRRLSSAPQPVFQRAATG